MNQKQIRFNPKKAVKWLRYLMNDLKKLNKWIKNDLNTPIVKPNHKAIKTLFDETRKCNSKREWIEILNTHTAAIEELDSNYKEYIYNIGDEPPLKKAYIAHPLRGDLEKNIASITSICQSLANQNQLIPISPIHAFSFMTPEGDQTQVLTYCTALLATCDELHVYGNHHSSEGCSIEINFAKQNNIPIIYK